MAVETDKAQLIARILELEEKMEQALFYPLMPAEWLNAELTMSQLKTLLTLSNSGPARTGTLASALGVSLATTTGIVDRLVERDLIRREGDPNDRRVVMCKLSDKGHEMVTRLWTSNRASTRGLLESVDPARLQDIAQALQTILDICLALPGCCPEGQQAVTKRPAG